ncbi:3-oxoacyl-[acyl-carrier-protein] synthase III C-terminal domain-containing protein [Streptomyces canus]|uniref:3-oxoacyl-[acyl-carrier-protein] synthase III C-terminal domain-containing protein n=1 Tax=Streptomyces canus TaxID=58343 RepID=UPI0038660EAC
MKEQHTDPNDLGLVCLHQPSVPVVRTFCERMGIQPDAVVPTFHRTGNMGAATLPLQLAHAADQGRYARAHRWSCSAWPAAPAAA